MNKTPQKKLDSNNKWKSKNPEYQSVYNKKYNADPVNKARKDDYNFYYRNEPVNKERKIILNKRNKLENPERTKYHNTGRYGYIKSIKHRYGLTEEMFVKIYEEQGGICLGCDIKLVSFIFEEERKQFDDDPNLVEYVDYEVAFVDHDHSYDIEGKCYSGNPDSIRGLLCSSCNAKDVLNPVSDFYIYGDDPMVRETLIKNREMNIILKEWRKEENSKK